MPDVSIQEAFKSRILTSHIENIHACIEATLKKIVEGKTSSAFQLVIWVRGVANWHLKDINSVLPWVNSKNCSEAMLVKLIRNKYLKVRNAAFSFTFVKIPSSVYSIILAQRGQFPTLVSKKWLKIFRVCLKQTEQSLLCCSKQFGTCETRQSKSSRELSYTDGKIWTATWKGELCLAFFPPMFSCIYSFSNLTSSKIFNVVNIHRIK